MATTLAGKRLTLSARRLGLGLPILIPFVLDFSMTLLGQAKNYWGSGYEFVNEANPVGFWLLRLHPLAYLNAGLLLFGFYLLVLSVLPLRLAKVFTILCTVGHTYGWFSWLKYVLNVSYFVRFGLILIPAVLLVYAFERVDMAG